MADIDCNSSVGVYFKKNLIEENCKNSRDFPEATYFISPAYRTQIEFSSKIKLFFLGRTQYVSIETGIGKNKIARAPSLRLSFTKEISSLRIAARFLPYSLSEVLSIRSFSWSNIWICFSPYPPYFSRQFWKERSSIVRPLRVYNPLVYVYVPEIQKDTG